MKKLRGWYASKFLSFLWYLRKFVFQIRDEFQHGYTIPEFFPVNELRVCVWIHFMKMVYMFIPERKRLGCKEYVIELFVFEVVFRDGRIAPFFFYERIRQTDRFKNGINVRVFADN